LKRVGGQILDAEKGSILNGRFQEISNLKLQKLLYYAQGFHMALNSGRKLFRDPIYAWAHGPVVHEVYHRFKHFGSKGIPRTEVASSPSLDADTVSLLEEVWQAYGQFSAWRLREMTHKEPPWQNTPQSALISDEKLLAYFSSQIETVDAT
jgi:uncharacterized phage-associated protein